MDPFVSVIIPTYCGAGPLRRAVNSVLRQTYTDLEIIVVDDNDPESEARRQTEAVIASLNAPNLRYIRHEKNLNGSAARNTGIRHASGEMLSFLDDDDVLLPGRIREAAELIREGNDIVFTNVLLQKYGRIFAAVEVRPRDDFFHALLLNPDLIGTGSNLFLRKETVLRAGGFDESLTRHQDYEFLIRVFSEDVRAGFADNYSIIKVMDRTQNTVRYEKLKEIKKQLFRKHLPVIERTLTKDEINTVMISHHVELFYTATLEHNRQGMREQKEILNGLGYQPGLKDNLRAWIKSIDRAGLTQQAVSIFRERKILAMLREKYPESYNQIQNSEFRVREQR